MFQTKIFKPIYELDSGLALSPVMSKDILNKDILEWNADINNKMQYMKVSKIRTEIS